MKSKSLTLITLAGLSLPLLAQGPPPPPDPVGRALDRDHDGEISRAEIRRAGRALQQLDENDDEVISADELRPDPPQRRQRRGQGQGGNRGQGNQRGNGGGQGNQGGPPPPRVSELMTALDRDGSGDLSKEEIAAAAESLAKLDRDDDGKLSREEAGLSQPGQGPGQGGGAGPGGGGPQGPRGPGGGPRGGGPRRGR